MTDSAFAADDFIRNQIVLWQRDLASMRRLSANTLEAYGRDLDQFVAFLSLHTGGPVTLATIKDLRGADIRAFMAQRRNESLGSRSLARVLSALKSFFRFLEREGVVATEALNVIRTPKLPKSLPKALTVAEARSTIEHGRANGRRALDRRPRHGSALALLRGGPAHRRSACRHPRRSRRHLATRHRQGRQDPPRAADRCGARQY